MKFQVVVANPPFSLDKWDSGFLSEAEADSKGKKKMSAELDQYHRFDWGVPPTSKGDYAFVLQTGMMGVQGTGAELLDNPEVKAAYLGKSRK